MPQDQPHHLQLPHFLEGDLQEQQAYLELNLPVRLINSMLHRRLNHRLVGDQHKLLGQPKLLVLARVQQLHLGFLSLKQPRPACLGN